MSLVGTYFCKEINSTFVVKEANVANGEAKGSIRIGDVIINVNIHFHFANNVGPVTDLAFIGHNDDPNEYVGGAGRTDTSFTSIKIAGGYPTSDDVSAFEGNFLRQ